jgi:hypothetical protein
MLTAHRAHLAKSPRRGYETTIGKPDDSERHKGGRPREWMRVSRGAAATYAPVILDVAARFCFPSKSQADTAAAWIRIRYDGSARLWRATRSGEWFVDGRIPRTRFDLERIRLLGAELADLAEAHGGVLIEWQAVRPQRGVRSRLHIRRRIRRRTVMIVGVDVAVAAIGLVIPAFGLVVAAIVAGVIEGAVWILVGRVGTRR